MMPPPPFLKRWAPYKYAEFAPDVFAWEARTNKLSLKEPHRDQLPWKVTPHHRQKDAGATWLYCETCHLSLFSVGAASRRVVPFRDKRSVENLV